MAKQKKPVHRVEMTEGKRNIIRQLLEEYDIETAEDIQDALKDLLSIPGDSEPPFRRCSTAVPFSTIPRIRDSDTVIPVR